jgi:hypothetical protein
MVSVASSLYLVTKASSKRLPSDLVDVLHQYKAEVIIELIVKQASVNHRLAVGDVSLKVLSLTRVIHTAGTSQWFLW